MGPGFPEALVWKEGGHRGIFLFTPFLAFSHAQSSGLERMALHSHRLGVGTRSRPVMNPDVLMPLMPNQKLGKALGILCVSEKPMKVERV